MAMFGRNGGGASQPPSTPPSDNNGAEQAAPQLLRMPQLSIWKLHRWEYPEGVETGNMQLVTYVISAHGITMPENGGVIFQTFYIDPAFGPTPRPTRAFTSYDNFEDITPAQPVEEASRIIH